MQRRQVEDAVSAVKYGGSGVHSGLERMLLLARVLHDIKSPMAGSDGIGLGPTELVDGVRVVSPLDAQDTKDDAQWANGIVDDIVDKDDAGSVLPSGCGGLKFVYSVYKVVALLLDAVSVWSVFALHDRLTGFNWGTLSDDVAPSLRGLLAMAVIRGVATALVYTEFAVHIASTMSLRDFSSDVWGPLRSLWTTAPTLLLLLRLTAAMMHVGYSKADALRMLGLQITSFGPDVLFVANKFISYCKPFAGALWSGREGYARGRRRDNPIRAAYRYRCAKLVFPPSLLVMTFYAYAVVFAAWYLDNAQLLSDTGHLGMTTSLWVQAICAPVFTTGVQHGAFVGVDLHDVPVLDGAVIVSKARAMQAAPGMAQAAMLAYIILAAVDRGHHRGTALLMVLVVNCAMYFKLFQILQRWPSPDIDEMKTALAIKSEQRDVVASFKGHTANVVPAWAVCCGRKAGRVRVLRTATLEKGFAFAASAMVAVALGVSALVRGEAVAARSDGDECPANRLPLFVRLQASMFIACGLALFAQVAQRQRRESEDDVFFCTARILMQVGRGCLDAPPDAPLPKLEDLVSDDAVARRLLEDGDNNDQREEGGEEKEEENNDGGCGVLLACCGGLFWVAWTIVGMVWSYEHWAHCSADQLRLAQVMCFAPVAYALFAAVLHGGMRDAPAPGIDADFGVMRRLVSLWGSPYLRLLGPSALKAGARYMGREHVLVARGMGLDERDRRRFVLVNQVGRSAMPVLASRDAASMAALQDMLRQARAAEAGAAVLGASAPDGGASAV